MSMIRQALLESKVPKVWGTAMVHVRAVLSTVKPVLASISRKYLHEELHKLLFCARDTRGHHRGPGVITGTRAGLCFRFARAIWQSSERYWCSAGKFREHAVSEGRSGGLAVHLQKGQPLVGLYRIRAPKTSRCKC